MPGRAGSSGSGSRAIFWRYSVLCFDRISAGALLESWDLLTPPGSQQAYQAIFGLTPRILAASFIAYLVGEFLNSFVLAKMKIATRGRHLWMRTIGSTVVGQFADTVFFIFWPSMAQCHRGL